VTEKRRGEIPRLGWKYFDRDEDPLLGQNLQQPQTRIRFSGARLTLLGRFRVWDLTSILPSFLLEIRAFVGLGILNLPNEIYLSLSINIRLDNFWDENVRFWFCNTKGCVQCTFMW